MPQYDEAENFSNGIEVVTTEIDGTDVRGAINMQGEVVLPFKYKGSLIWYPEEEVFTVAEKHTRKEGHGNSWIGMATQSLILNGILSQLVTTVQQCAKMANGE